MTRKNLLRHIAMAATLMLAASGSPSGFAQPVAESPAATPSGTVITFHRKSSGSLGAYDAPVAWTFTQGTWEGRPAVIQSAARVGGGVMDPKTHALMANLDPQGKTISVFDPPIGFQWPLQVGKTWTSKHTVSMLATGRTMSIELNWKVDALEDVTVPAGTYKAFKVMSTSNTGEVETRWVAPAAGVLLARRLVTRPATHPQGAGELEAVLLSQVPPAR